MYWESVLKHFVLIECAKFGNHWDHTAGVTGKIKTVNLIAFCYSIWQV